MAKFWIFRSSPNTALSSLKTSTMRKMRARISTIRSSVANEFVLRCQRVARTSTATSSEQVACAIEVSVVKYRHHVVGTDRDPQNALHDADHDRDHGAAEGEVAVAAEETRGGAHSTTSQRIRSTGPQQSQSGVLKSIISAHDAVGKT